MSELAEFDLYDASFEELAKKLLEVIEKETDNGYVKDIEREVIQKIKNGYTYKLNWLWLRNEQYEEYWNTGRVKITGYGKIPLSEFHEDKDWRETEMRRIIKTYSEDEPITTPRE